MRATSDAGYRKSRERLSMVMLLRSNVGGCPPAPSVAGIEIRARKTELGSNPGGTSAGVGPLTVKGDVAAAPDFAARMLRFKLCAGAAESAPLGSAPVANHESCGSFGEASFRKTSCMAKESRSRFAENASVAL